MLLLYIGLPCLFSGLLMYVFQNHGVDLIYITMRIDALPQPKAVLHTESINFPGLGVICGKWGKNERGKKGVGGVSLKLSELSNFYHLQRTLLPPCFPLDVKWQGRTQGLAAGVGE